MRIFVNRTFPLSEAAVWLACGYFLGLLGGCAVPQQAQRRTVEPWLRDGQNVGTITKTMVPSGFDYSYQDLQRRLVRVEKRDPNRQLLSGACTVVFEYDTSGQLAVVRHLDAADQPCLNQSGFAGYRSTHSTDQNSNRITENAFFDCAGRPVATQGGYAVERFTHGQGGQLVRVQFLDSSRRPVGSLYLGVPGVAEAQYSYLEGVGTVTCVALLDPSGAVVARKQLSGVTDVSNTFTTYSSSYNTYRWR
jgi:hypothetical protein